jgi:hypothetical protein
MLNWLREMVEVLVYRRKLIPLPVERLEEIPIDPYLGDLLQKNTREQFNNSLDRDGDTRL